MELCMEAKALKSSLRRELALKSTQQAFIDEFWCATGISGVPSEDFSVDDLLDLSNGEFEDGSVEEEEEEKDSVSVDDESSNSSNFVSADSESALASQLLVPDDDLAGLEWVSHFVDDSLLDLSLLHPVGTQKPEALALTPSEPEAKPVQSRPTWFPSQVPVKPRTKRCRAASRVWSYPSSSSPSSSSSCSSGFSFSTPCPIFNNPVHNTDVFVGEPATKKQKKKPAVQTGVDGSVGVQFQRRCSHCHVQKTPQWRTGPLGAKTLCNACGVRFKSGRLFPEYRPACSPTFSGDVHSNSHRKVLEMRKRKEAGGPESGLNRVIPSF
ncbi:GATA transcription factor 5-like [Prunus avium]|uniref:GATA transcription factor n=1 Tax=Prunus avium TaxID=42229 RepID=A0A6P5RYU4_PRUAV|nr:GATA transcription factor 5-like [Prunus avium]